MSKLYIDIETYATVSLKKTGVYRYVQDPEFLILMAAYALDDEPVQVVFGRDILLIPGLWDEDVLKVAHNAQFERICFSEAGRDILEVEPGEYLPPHHWHDTMAVAAELGRPQSLDMLAKALGVSEKDSAGTRLINWFCLPDPRTGKRRRPEDHPEKWAQFVEYCRQDVVALRDVDRALGGFPTDTERDVYLTDQLINDRGIELDIELAEAAVVAARENAAEQEQEVIDLTGVDNPGSVQQLQAWFEGDGLELPDLRAETISEALTWPVTPTQRRVLELRQELALTASKKYTAALETVCEDGRMRGGFRFFGAHTGRWAGRGLQPHNLPREQLESETATDAAILDLKLGWGASAYTLKALVRALFLGPLSVSDYAAIEARVIAWLAGEEWALQAFRDGRDIYVETAERMSSPTRTFERRDGKIAVLALGYSGGINSLRAMGAEGNDDELQVLVGTWRASNTKIVTLWRQLDEAFLRGGKAGRVRVVVDGDSRRIELPSGRAIHYHDVAWERYKVKDPKTGKMKWKEGWRYANPKNPFNKNMRIGTYGGRLAENVTQAVARDVLAEALVRLQSRGYPVVGHVHDEVLVEGTDYEEVSRVISEPPAWAPGLPIGAEGFSCRRYRKG